MSWLSLRQAMLSHLAAGVVEAWAGGSTWDQIVMDCNLDDGDIARLLNRYVVSEMQYADAEGHSAAVIKLTTSPLAHYQSLTVDQSFWRRLRECVKVLLGGIRAALHCSARLCSTPSCSTINAGRWTS